MSNQQTNEPRTRQTLSRKSTTQLPSIEDIDPEQHQHANNADGASGTHVPEIVNARLQRVDGAASTEDREARIAARAYDLASRRGFAPGNELDDWLQAEKEFDADAPLKPEDQFTG